MAAARQRLQGGASPESVVLTAQAALARAELARDRRLLREFLAELRYTGYIQRQQKQVDQLASQEASPLPPELDYTRLPGLRTEAAQTLNRFRPATLGQAARLAGVNPADLMVVSVALSSIF